jgi:hypothetical protein
VLGQVPPALRLSVRCDHIAQQCGTFATCRRVSRQSASGQVPFARPLVFFGADVFSDRQLALEMQSRARKKPEQITPAKTVTDTGIAPYIFFEGAPNFGFANGVVNVTLAAVAKAAGARQPVLYVEFRKDGVPVDPGSDRK